MTTTIEGRQEAVEWLRPRAKAITGLDISLGPSDLDDFGTMVGGARVVGLGEMWHSCKEFLKIRWRLTRYLIEQLDFSVVLLEGPLATWSGFDNAVNGDSDVQEAVESAAVFYSNEETFAFLAWLREFTKRTGRKVRVFGMGGDALQVPSNSPRGPVAEVEQFLSKVDPAYDPAVTTAIADFYLGYWRDEENRGQMRGPSYFRGTSAAIRRALEEASRELVVRLALGRYNYESRASVLDYEWALRAALVLLQTNVLNGIEDANAQLVAREAIFVENIRWAIEQGGVGARAVVLAHNTHTARATGFLGGPGAGLVSLGRQLSSPEAGDRNYLAVATTFRHGEFAESWPTRTGATTFPPADPDTVDMVLTEACDPPFYVDIRAEREEDTPSWFGEAHHIRNEDSSAGGNTPWIRNLTAKGSFDVFIHLGEIHRPDQIST